jgi:hypothetical protein
LLSALRREPVELGFPVVFRGAVVEIDPAAFDEAMKGWVKGSLLDLQHFFGALLDGPGNLVAVQRTSL